MRLTELDPRWLEKDGHRVGLTFLCPHCRNAADRLTCFFEPTTFRDQVELMLPITGGERGARIDWIPSKTDFAWTASPDIAAATFENLTIHPSIDASKSGHWHGWIKNGEVT